ncbi:hypothetical protein BT96DRAFT_999840 [Gymnopus androsaceus JB14]|uniref:Uncharacterized protein n=1 Tax=Gymnopus androsaceus JB14 TaxID=1447944 RepID=A0A6A4H5I6_9AGAR|nr:hypothetical protein BT96DRAFT_999840 [Gymnopus androsaceus JB14]
MKSLSSISKWLKVTEPFPRVLCVEISRSPINAFSNECVDQVHCTFTLIDIACTPIQVLEGLWNFVRYPDQRSTRYQSCSIMFSLPKIFTVGLDRTYPSLHHIKIQSISKHTTVSAAEEVASTITIRARWSEDEHEDRELYHGIPTRSSRDRDVLSQLSLPYTG